MRVIFMGTPDFSVPALEALIQEHEVAAVVTQPDKPKGRGKAMAFPPVKETAIAHGIDVLQPARVREEGFVEKLAAYKPDVIVVVAFGQILPEQILNLPPHGCINIHASLLPAYRGAAPIQWAIINGEKETGVTTMYMEKGLDTGDMIDRVVIPVKEKETGGSLHDKLSAAGGSLILKTLAGIEAGTATRARQDDSKSSYAGMLDKEMGRIDWSRSAVQIERLIRGLNPWPSAYSRLLGKTVKIWEADAVSALFDEPETESEVSGAAPGTILLVTKDSFYVQTGDGILKVNEIQLQGKKRMPVKSFLLGYPLKAGTVLPGDA